VNNWAPGQITMFFSPKYRENPLKTGSLGGAFTIEEGISAKIFQKNINGDEIYFNSQLLENGPSLDVIEIIRKQSNKKIPFIEVIQKGSLPMSAGLSTSGAGALATARAINEEFELGFSEIQLGQFAHLAELKNYTGLGSVLTQFHTGILIRSIAGAPGYGKVVKLDLPPKKFRNVLILSWGGLSTSKILRDKEKMKKIYELGELFTKEAIKKADLETLFSLGEQFTKQCGLASGNVLYVLNRISRDELIGSGMAMLGETMYFVGSMNALNKIMMEFDAPFSLLTKIYERNLNSSF